jgi:LPS export ABC transporter protein LptC
MFVTLIFLAACESETKNTPPDTQKSNVIEPDQVMTDAEIYLTRDGVRKGTIKSKELKEFTRYDSTLLYDVTVLFFDEKGQHTSTLTADSAVVRQNANLMSAFGNVKAWTEDKRKLVADSLRWDANRDLIVTDGYVEVYRGNDTLTGYGLEADQRLKSTVIKRNLKGSFSQPEETARQPAPVTEPIRETDVKADSAN